MVHRISRKVSAGGLKAKAAKKPSSSQLLSSLKAQIGEKESKRLSGRRAELEEEKRYLQHVKAEMHLHAK